MVVKKKKKDKLPVTPSSEVAPDAVAATPAPVAVTPPAIAVTPPPIPAPRPAETTAVAGPTREQIAKLAYRFYLARGQKAGSAREDWQRAERELKGGNG